MGDKYWAPRLRSHGAPPRYESAILQKENGLLWKMGDDGTIWASWSAWDHLEEESPLFIETIETRLWGPKKETGK